MTQCTNTIIAQYISLIPIITGHQARFLCHNGLELDENRIVDGAQLLATTIISLSSSLDDAKSVIIIVLEALVDGLDICNIDSNQTKRFNNRDTSDTSLKLHQSLLTCNLISLLESVAPRLTTLDDDVKKLMIQLSLMPSNVNKLIRSGLDSILISMSMITGDWIATSDVNFS